MPVQHHNSLFLCQQIHIIRIFNLTENRDDFFRRKGHAKKIYNYLVGKGIIVRNRTSISLCRDCLRVTIGTRPENDMLLEALKNYEC